MSWFLIKLQSKEIKKERGVGEVNISPGFPRQPLCLWVEIKALFGMSDTCLGFQPAPATDVLCAQPIHTEHFQQPDKPGISMCCIIFFPGNPMRILQSGNNKIYMIHQCSLNKLAFAALHLTSCSSSALAGAASVMPSLGHGVCSWVCNVWRMLWNSQFMGNFWLPPGPIKAGWDLCRGFGNLF